MLLILDAEEVSGSKDAEKTSLYEDKALFRPSCDNGASSVEPSHSTIDARNNIIITEVTERSRSDLVR